MTSYQEHIVGAMRQIATDLDCTPTTQMDFSNVGTLIVMDGLRTVLTAGYDFQTYRVHIRFNGASLGPRSEDVYWWKPGDPVDDSEVVRMMARLTSLIESHKGSS